ncbi:cupin domain-containing protein [Herbaspirillum sp. RV1423]|uniref:cupin domain-containing protein n=1 Tax=Herbaspirillum sp. RV1423 TaxID=1443993 RepID=UPI0004B5A3A2|nr:cupin domain-containing protein [Herbaspirillum sp. RV1423]
MIAQQQLAAGERHCERLEIDWQAPGAPSQSAIVDGEHLSIGISTYTCGEQSEAAADPQGEEVATVLAGSFLVEAAGERYELSPGEGIIIPPREPRRWTCQSERGALYRVITRLDNPPPQEPT